MSEEIKVGDRVKKSTGSYARVGTVLRFTTDGKIAVVQHRGGFRGQTVIENRYLTSELVRTCREDIFSDYSSHPCDKKVKEDGLCGLHLSAKKRAKARQEAEASRWQARTEARKAMQKRIDSLNLDSKVVIHDHSVDLVIIKLSELERIVNDK